MRIDFVERIEGLRLGKTLTLPSPEYWRGDTLGGAKVGGMASIDSGVGALVPSPPGRGLG
jgi:hypothetical protein